jgi:hypothetical protein
MVVMKRLVFVLFFLCAVLRAESVEYPAPLWRVVYANDSLLLDKREEPLVGKERKERLSLMKEVYGTKLFLIDYTKPPPKSPKKLEGTVLHIDGAPKTGDELWVQGDKNPLLDFNRIRARVRKDFGIEDLDDKYDGYRFIKKVLPKNAAPEQRLGSSFTRKYESDEMEMTDKQIEEKVDAALRKYKQDPEEVKDLRRRTIRLEKIRERINSRLGTSFIKVRSLNHSEGKLPKSNQDWIEDYIYYVLKTKDEVLKAEEKSEKTETPLAELLVEIEDVEGRVLDEFLSNPKDIVVQKKVSLHREVRAHLSEGKVLPMGTYLRFYDWGDYLPEYEREAFNLFLEEVVMGKFNKMGPPYDKFSMTPDLVLIDKEGLKDALKEASKGNYRALFPFISILDENVDQQSGYFYPQEDRYTAGDFAKRYSGQNSQFLAGFEEYKSLPLGKEKAQRLKDLRKRYKIFEGNNATEAFWDPVFIHAMDILKRSPDGETLHQVFRNLRDSGLRSQFTWARFIEEVQKTYPRLKLSPKHGAQWTRYLTRLETDEAEFYLNKAGRIADRYKPYDPEAVPKGCKGLKELGTNP